MSAFNQLRTEVMKHRARTARVPSLVLISPTMVHLLEQDEHVNYSRRFTNPEISTAKLVAVLLGVDEVRVIEPYEVLNLTA